MNKQPVRAFNGVFQGRVGRKGSWVGMDCEVDGGPHADSGCAHGGNQEFQEIRIAP